MPLEATMMLIDNSEYMRNGDYMPSRFEAQSDAVTTVFTRKTDSNPENTVGVMTMAGKAPEVLVTHTKDLGQLLGALHESTSKLGGQSDITTAISVAQLALKHRTNKNLRQRIIVFVGSPLSQGADEKSMVKLAKKLKKNNVAVDVVSFGEDESREPNDQVLRAFVESANSGENSHFITVAPGARLLSDMVIASPILAEDGVGIPGDMDGIPAEAGGSGAGNNFEFGVDPSMDPELAMALRMSMEEERARQAQQERTAGGSSTLESVPENQAAAGGSGSTTSTIPMETVPGAATQDEEERMLAEALALSTQEEEDVDVEMGDGVPGDEELTEEEAIARAIAMSMEEGEGDQKGAQQKK